MRQRRVVSDKEKRDSEGHKMKYSNKSVNPLLSHH